MFKLLKFLFVGLAISGPHALAGNMPPIDDNAHISNPDLVAAIEHLKIDESDTAKDALLAPLNKAHFLVVMLDDKTKTEKNNNSSPTNKNGSLIKLLYTSDGQGNMYLPVFTDLNTLRKYTNKPVNTLVFPSQYAWHWALTMGDYHGIVINPGVEDTLSLNKSQIEYLMDQSLAHKVNLAEAKRHSVDEPHE